MTKILIVEDEQSIAEALADTLRDEGYEVAVAFNGRQGLEAAKREPPDLVISDIMMPVMDGLRLCGALREDPSFQGLPVILMSAAPPKVAAGVCGYSTFLHKPFDVDRLIEVVAQYSAGQRPAD